MIGGDEEAAVFVGSFAIGIAGALGDPGTLTGAKHGFERGDEAAGGHFPMDVAGGVARMYVGLAVRDGEETASLEAIADEGAQAFGSPERIGSIAEAGFFLGGGARGGEAGGEAGGFALHGAEGFLLGKFHLGLWLALVQFAQPFGEAIHGPVETPA